MPTYIVQRWRLQILRCDFTISNRPDRVMVEIDLLSRYNEVAERLW